MKAFVIKLGLKVGWNLIFRRKKGKYQPLFFFLIWRLGYEDNNEQRQWIGKRLALGRRKGQNRLTVGSAGETS